MIQPYLGCVVTYADMPGFWVMDGKKGTTALLRSIDSNEVWIERADYYKCKFIAAYEGDFNTYWRQNG